MLKEIERKFLITGDAWRRGASGTSIRQGFLSTDPARVVRVRVEGNRGTLTVKGMTVGAVRPEYEYEIPVEDAEDLLDNVVQPPLVEKVRYRVEHAGKTWEVDVFEGENEGLVVAEIELQSEEERFARPDWVGEEVTKDPRYYNSNLVRRPYRSW